MFMKLVYTYLQSSFVNVSETTLWMFLTQYCENVFSPYECFIDISVSVF